MHEIEKGIPLPTYMGKRRVYPWHEMEVGDSFVTTSSTVRGAAFSQNRRYGTKFLVRKNGEDYRVWRIA